MYAADFGDWAHDPDSDLRWRPSIFMPRWASRITVEVTEVRVQRVQGITAEDAIAEGVNEENVYCEKHPRAVCAYALLWDHINEKRGFGWDVNPWVWAVSFKRVKEEPVQAAA